MSGSYRTVHPEDQDAPGTEIRTEMHQLIVEAAGVRVVAGDFEVGACEELGTRVNR